MFREDASQIVGGLVRTEAWMWRSDPLDAFLAMVTFLSLRWSCFHPLAGS